MQVDYVRVYGKDNTPNLNIPVVPANVPNKPANVPNKPANVPNKPTNVPNKPEVCYEGACPTNINDCLLNSVGKIYCQNCPEYALNWLRCGGVSDPDHLCDSNAGCSNGSLCSVNSENKVYCTGCPKGYSGHRCEIKPKRNLRGTK